jgi:hypothetical protein
LLVALIIFQRKNVGVGCCWGCWNLDGSIHCHSRSHSNLAGITLDTIFEDGRDDTHQSVPEAEAFKLQQMDLDPSVADLARPFTGLESEEMYILQTQTDRCTLKEIEANKGNTYVPADSPWIRLEYEGQGHDDTYIARSDAQKLALALLVLPWHPEGCLVGGSRDGVGMQLLTRSAERLMPMMTRVRDNLSFLTLGEQEKKRLLASLDPMVRRLENTPSSSLLESRSALKLMYKLDQILEELGSGEQYRATDLIVGILMITNFEFQRLVYQSIRHLKEVTTSTIQLDMRATTLKVPSAFGVMQHFYMDMDQIAPGENRSHETLPVSHTVVVLAAMRSALRSMMLRSCVDADLFFGYSDETKRCCTCRIMIVAFETRHTAKGISEVSWLIGPRYCGADC